MSMYRNHERTTANKVLIGFVIVVLIFSAWLYLVRPRMIRHACNTKAKDALVSNEVTTSNLERYELYYSACLHWKEI